MIKPVGSNLICEEQSSSRKLEVRDSNNPVVKATVVEIGLGDYKYSEEGQPIYEPMQVRPGMTVYFLRDDAIEFELDKQKVYRVHQSQLLCFEDQ